MGARIFLTKGSTCETQEAGCLPTQVSGVAMLPVGALYFYQTHIGCTVLPQWPLWAHLFYSVFYRFQGLGGHASACVAEAVLLPGTLFHAETFALPPYAPPNPTSALGGFPVKVSCWSKGVSYVVSEGWAANWLLVALSTQISSEFGGKVPY